MRAITKQTFESVRYEKTPHPRGFFDRTGFARFRPGLVPCGLTRSPIRARRVFRWRPAKFPEYTERSCLIRDRHAGLRRILGHICHKMLSCRC